MPRNGGYDDDAPSARDLWTMWKSIGFVITGIISLGVFVIVLVQWGSGQTSSSDVQAVQIDAIWKTITTLERRLEQIERDHILGWNPPQNQQYSPRTGGP